MANSPILVSITFGNFLKTGMSFNQHILFVSGTIHNKTGVISVQLNTGIQKGRSFIRHDSVDEESDLSNAQLTFMETYKN